MTNLEYYENEILHNMYGYSGGDLHQVIFELFCIHHYSAEPSDTSLKCILDWLYEEHKEENNDKSRIS